MDVINLPNGRIKCPLDEEKARELLDIVRARIATRAGYAKLAGLSFFFFIYFFTILMQINVEVSYEVESSVIMSNIMASLPTNGQGGFFNGGGPGSTGMLASSDQLLEWMGQVVVPSLFQDSVCGDGQCDDDEKPALGRFGCFKDCGKVPDTDTIRIEILLQTADQNIRFYGGGEIRLDSDPGFKYNIYSKIYKDFIFREPVAPSNKSISISVLRNDTLELRFYQANSVSVSKEDLQMDLGCLSKTVPERKAATDYGYGDNYERLAVARSQRTAVQAYCQNCGADGCKARLESIACRLGNDFIFEPTSASLLGLSAYGMAGRITSPVLNVSTGKMEYISLLENSISEIRYCSFFSDYTKTGRLKYYSDFYGWEENFHMWQFLYAFEDTIWKEMKDVEIPCTAQSKLRSTKKQNLQDVDKKYTASRRHQLHVDIAGLQRLSGKRKKQGKHQLETQASGPLVHATVSESAAFSKLSLKRDFTRDHPDTQQVAPTVKPPARVLLMAQQNDSDWNQNLLNLTLADIGVDGGFVWWNCYDDRPECIRFYQIDTINNTYNFDSDYSDRDTKISETEKQYRYSGVVFAAVDIPNFQGSLSLNLDGSGAKCYHPSENGTKHSTLCLSGNDQRMFEVQVARVLKYNGKTRIVLYALPFPFLYYAGWDNRDFDFLDLEFLNERASEIPVCTRNLYLTVWECEDESMPLSVSNFNVTAALEGVDKIGLTSNWNDIGKKVMGTLEPGPQVRICVPVTRELDDSELDALRQRICGRVWNISELGDDEVCEWRLWTEMEIGLNVEIWRNTGNDFRAQWIKNSDLDVNTEVQTVCLTVLMESNTAASRARYLITKEVNSPEFIQLFHVLEMRNVTSSGETSARTSDGFICSRSALQMFAESFPSWDGGGCLPCYQCFDPIDGVCPEDKCGPLVGAFPKCWDAQRLGTYETCRDRYRLNLTAVADTVITNDVGGGQNIADEDNATNSTSNVPEETLVRRTRRARFITPFNRLIGAVIIRQKRLKAPSPENGTNTGSSDTCGLQNSAIAQYSSTADPKRGLPCLKGEPDSAFFGTDPVFAPFSSLYQGKVDPFGFYNVSEFANIQSQNPFGFFPHKYDPLSGGYKTNLLVSSEAEHFLVFLDERISGVHAQNLITYLVDGGFIDDQTQEVSVELNTLNSGSKTGGGIYWDYHIGSVLVNADQSIAYTILSFVSMGLLALNVLSEVSDIITAIVNFELLQYLRTGSNLLDWCHFVLIIIGWILWNNHVERISKFDMQSQYNVLRSSADQTEARFLSTNSDEEKKFLDFSKAVSELEQSLRIYTNMISISVVLFVYRLLKALDFQPRMALVTRTIATAFSDLLHFLVLFGIIYWGYVLAGFLMFGHQFYSFSTLSLSGQFLILILLSFDPTQMWVQMEHAALSSVTFYLYIWSWVFLAIFVLLNIFLAILIEGYTVVKSSSVDSSGMPEELARVLSHEASRISRILFGRHSTAFISDDALFLALSAELQHTPASLNRVLNDYSKIALGTCVQVNLKSGNMDTLAVRQLLLSLPLLKETFCSAGSDSASLIESGQNGETDNIYLDTGLLDLMGRYGRISNQLERQDDNQAQRWTQTQMLTISADLIGNSNVNSSPGSLNFPEQDITVRLHLECARGVGRMDVFTGADLYCAAFVGYWGQVEGNGENAGNRLFQTTIRRGKSEADWIWNENFVWTLNSVKGTDSRKIVVMVYDKDQFTADDVVGSVEISLNRLRHGPVVGWQSIVRPMMPSQKGVLDQLWTFLTGPQPKAELKMAVALEATEAQAGSLCTPMIQQLHSESNLHLRMPEIAPDYVQSQLTYVVTPPQLQAGVIVEHPALPVYVGKC